MLLVELPDDLLMAIFSFDIAPSWHHLMLTCKRWFRLCRGLYCFGMLFEDNLMIASQLEHQCSLMRQLLAHSDDLVGGEISKAKVMRIVDQVLYHNRCPETLVRFFHKFKMEIVQEIVPGIYIDCFQRAPRSLPIMARRTLYGAFGIDTNTLDQMKLDVHPFIAEIVRDEMDNRDEVPLDFEKVAQNDFFETDLIEFHAGLWRLFHIATRRFDLRDRMQDADFLWALARIGLRVRIDLYLSNAGDVNRERVQRRIPYLSPWRCSFVGTRSLFETRIDLLPIFFRNEIFRIWLVQEIAYYLYCKLAGRKFEEFRTVARTLHGWPYFKENQLPGRLLEIGLNVDAPLDILDFILDCPAESLANYNISRIRFRNRDVQTHVVQRFVSKLSNIDSRFASRKQIRNWYRLLKRDGNVRGFR